MAITYLDHNVISDIAGIPGTSKSGEMRAHAYGLKMTGMRFVLSIWNLYEIARSSNLLHIEQCIAFVEELKPLWLDTTSKIERWEINKFLNFRFHSAGLNCAAPISPFYETFEELCGALFENSSAIDSIRESVTELKARPTIIQKIEVASNETVEAIKILREGKRNGRYSKNQILLDLDYIQRLSGLTFSQSQSDSFGKRQIDLFSEAHT